MAVQSHSFLRSLKMTEEPEKMSLVANPVERKEGAPYTENTASEFHKTTDERFKDEEQRRTEEGTGSHNLPVRRVEEQEELSASDRECRSVSVATRSRSRSSSVSSRSSYGWGRRGDRRRDHGDRRRRRRRSYCSSSSGTSSSRSRSRSRPRSRPRPRCHRAPAHSRCCQGRRYRACSPSHYRARSRSYSPSPSPPRRTGRRGPPRSRSRSLSRCSGPRRVYGLVGRSRLTLALSPKRRSRTRSRSRSRSPDRSSAHLSLQEKKQLLLVASERAAQVQEMEETALPVSGSVSATLIPDEPPRAPPSPTESSDQADVEQEVPFPKLCLKNKISFSINNSVAKPVAGRSSVSPEKIAAVVRSYNTTGHNPYGHWVPVKSRPFPKSSSKRSPTKSR